MASQTSNVYEDLTTAFIRHREGRPYDRDLDRKKPELILSEYSQIFHTYLFFLVRYRIVSFAKCSLNRDLIFRENQGRGRKNSQGKRPQKHFQDKPSFCILDDGSNSCILLLRFLHRSEI